ncbi:unnamed protein product [Darwinula stevensoni]|uniref:Methyltransferase type 11 domain-containing protein n=1 Tax=Darwinula stevensoni TaxID=69355 RepID=A0A7R9A1A3_9CRUS|nr:unnamed protein product [Darwinula stevensoni]CAG0887304.1 unnamed protein product [Darwinula stevensoni]
MLATGKSKGIYMNTIVTYIGKDHPIPIEDETYDLEVTSGSFAPGHMYPDSIPELVRVIKRGGHGVWARRLGYEKKSPQFGKFDEEMQGLVSQGVIKVLKEVHLTNYLLGQPGVVHVFQKL